MPAVERNGHGSFAQQFVETDNASRLIGQMKGRHEIAGLRGG